MIEAFERDTETILIHGSKQTPLDALIDRRVLEAPKKKILYLRANASSTHLILLGSLHLSFDETRSVSSGLISCSIHKTSDRASLAQARESSILHEAKSFGILYEKKNETGVFLFSDSDHNSEHDLVSRTSYVGYINESLISWNSKKLASIISMSG